MIEEFANVGWGFWLFIGVLSALAIATAVVGIYGKGDGGGEWWG